MIDLKARIADASEYAAVLEDQPTRHEMEKMISRSLSGADRFVAGRLLERSREEFGRQPRKALTLAWAAVRVAARAGSPDLQFEGWRDCASLFVRLGRYGEAWEALNRAGTFVASTREPNFSRGLLLYARAYVGSQPDEWKLDDALRWTEEAAQIFESTDQKRLRATAEMRAFIHNVKGEHAAAVEICRDLWNCDRTVGLALNYAAYLIDYGEPESAHELLSWATEHFTDADIVNVGKHADIQGMAYVAQRNWLAATDAFQRAVQAFRSIAMEDTAIRVELSRIRSEVSGAPDSIAITERAIAGVRRLANASAAMDQSEPTRRRRFTAEAFQYLRELAEFNALNLDSLRHVESYLSQITRGPVRPFVRPVPASIM